MRRRPLLAVIALAAAGVVAPVLPVEARPVPVTPTTVSVPVPQVSSATTTGGSLTLASTGDLQPGDRGSIYEQVRAMGAPDLLLEHFAGRLEYHHPWHHDREVSHLFRGFVDASEADAVLAEHGFEALRLVDNGAMHSGTHTLGDLQQIRVYHLIPAGVSKAKAVAAHMRARGLRREDCIAAGDSREDLAVGAEVGTFWLVANAIERDPTIREAVVRLDGTVRVTEAGYGPGVYEAVVTTLAERR